MTEDLELSRRLTGIVASTAGVTEIYPSGSFVHAVTLEIINAVTSDSTDDAKVLVSRDSAGELTIGVTIGVESGHPVPLTMRSVSDAVRQEVLLDDPTTVVRTIDVKVSHIEQLETRLAAALGAPAAGLTALAD